MKKLILLAGAAIMIAPATLALADKDKTPAKVQCAVMKDHTVDVKDATAKKMFADYKGNRYFFCCGGCPGQFKANPAKFAKSAHIKTPKEGKKA